LVAGLERILSIFGFLLVWSLQHRVCVFGRNFLQSRNDRSRKTAHFQLTCGHLHYGHSQTFGVVIYLAVFFAYYGGSKGVPIYFNVSYNLPHVNCSFYAAQTIQDCVVAAESMHLCDGAGRSAAL
jgi:hypothetical protein